MQSSEHQAAHHTRPPENVTAQVIVTAPGSLGDVNPMLAIARQLQQSGHDVLFLAAERYLPMAFDQFDNAERVANLKCGSWLPMNKQTAGRLTTHLRHLPKTSSGCTAVARRIAAQPPAAALAVDKIQHMLAGRSS